MRLKHLLSVFLTLLTLSVGQMWGADPVVSAAPSNNKEVVIAVYSSNKYYALPTGTVSSSTISGTEVTLNGSGKVSSTDATGKVWTLEEGTGSNAGKYYIKYTSGNTTNYLYKNGTNGTNYKFAVGSSKNYWSFSTNGTGYTVTAIDRGSNNTKIQYYSGAFRCYSTASSIILLEVAAAGPTITKSSSMTTLTYSNGSPVAQSFTIGGSNLTNTVTVTAPTDYEVCKTANGTYASSVSFTNTEVNAADKTVYIRLQSGLTAGNISSRNISIASEGATTQTIAITGSVPYTITWMANGNEHATTYVAVGSTLTLPATDPFPNSCGCTGKAFYGWYGGGTSYKNASVAPSIAAAGNAVNADKTYYAVFADADEEETPEPITEKLTVGSNGGTWPATGNKMSSAKVGDVSFTALGSGDNDSKYYTSDNTWRFYTNNTSGVKVSVPSGGIITKVNVTWKTTIPATPSGWSRNQATSPTTYTPNSGTEVNEVSFTKTSSGNVLFQVIEVTYTPAGGGTTYSNYATSCCSPLGSINGSFSRTNLLILFIPLFC